MRKLPGLVLALLTAMSAALQSGKGQAGDRSLRDQLVGAWQLAVLEEPDAGGKLHRADCTGLLVFTRDGHMSVQVMYRSPQARSDAASAQYTLGGYEASFGTYAINDAHSFVFHVEGALVRSLIGKDLKREFELSINRLVVKSSDPNEHWRAVWERH
jgi:hypothetical protein